MKGSVEKIREARAGRSPRPSALVYLIGKFHPGALGSEVGALMFESINPRHEQEWPIARPPNARPAALRAIPPGETRSYAQIARRIGRPTATRAVARANGANRIALMIPCHRVIGSDGSLTGYGGGLWRKQRLIEIERDLKSTGMTERKEDIA